jgi:hypothetical protein
MWPAIDGARSPQFKLDCLANPMEEAGSDYLAIQ